MEAGWKQDGGKMGAGWKQDGSRMEAGWKQDGGRMEARWEQGGSRMEAGWRQDGGRMGARCELGTVQAHQPLSDSADSDSQCLQTQQTGSSYIGSDIPSGEGSSALCFSHRLFQPPHPPR